MRVAIIGSRDARGLTVEEVICHIPQNCSHIFSGGAHGVDTLAKQAAQQLQIPLTEYLPDYAHYGKRAPLVRNQHIIAQADLVLAFWDMSSRGSAYTIAQCIQQHIPIKIINLNQREKA